MNTKKHNALAAVVAAVALTTAGCSTTTETASAPSSASASGSTNDRELFREQSRAAERRLEHNGELGIPGPVISQLAEVAAQDGTPLAFSWGDGCTWVRTPDGALWALHSGGGALVRDEKQLAWFRANPGAQVAKQCEKPAESLPTRPDPAVSTPYRWLDGATTKVSVNGRAYALPPLISERGVVLVAEASAGPTTPTN